MRLPLLLALLLSAARAQTPPHIPASPVPPAATTLSAFGAVLAEDAEGLEAAGVWKGSPADRAGLRESDRVLSVALARTRTPTEVAAALRALSPERRESLVVRRGLRAVALSGEPSAPPSDFTRGSQDLSAREWVLTQARSEKLSAAARDEVASAPPIDWALRADQALWVRWPKGLNAGLQRGDVVRAEVSAAMTTDGAFDFLAVPSGSQMWARVLESSDDGEIRSLRLAFYKLRLAGGGVYPILGLPTTLASEGSPELARMSPAGTLVVASAQFQATEDALPDEILLLGEDARLRVRLLEPVAIVEPTSWWRAGPGLWIKTVDKEEGRLFEVTHAPATRSAAAAGLKPGDLLDSIGGKSSDKLDFAQALDRLYGAPSSTVKVSVLRGGSSVTLKLKRGVKIEKGTETALPLPFEAL